MSCMVVSALCKYRPDLESVMASVSRNSQKSSIPFLKEHGLWNSWSSRLYNQMTGTTPRVGTINAQCKKLSYHTVRIIKESRLT